MIVLKKLQNITLCVDMSDTDNAVIDIKGNLEHNAKWYTSLFLIALISDVTKHLGIVLYSLEKGSRFKIYDVLPKNEKIGTYRELWRRFIISYPAIVIYKIYRNPEVGKVIYKTNVGNTHINISSTYDSRIRTIAFPVFHGSIMFNGNILQFTAVLDNYVASHKQYYLKYRCFGDPKALSENLMKVLSLFF